LRAAHREPRLSAGPSADGAGPIELVSPLRPQPAVVRAQHLLGEAGGLPQGHAAHLSRSGAGQLRGIAAGSNTLIRWFVAIAAHPDRVSTRRVWFGARGAAAGAET